MRRSSKRKEGAKPKVAHITTVDVSLRYLLLNQLQALQEDGYDVVGISAPGDNVAMLEEAGIPHIAIPMTRRITPLQDLSALYQLYRVMRDEQFDVVHTHTPKPSLLGQIAAKAARVPVIVNTLHGFYFHDHMKPALRRFYIALETLAALCSDAILSQNPEDIQTAIRERIAKDKKLAWLGNGIDVSRFDPKRITKRTLNKKRKELGLPKGKLIVGFVGRLVEEKGIYELFEAAQLVREVVPDVHFLIVGPEDHEKPDAINSRSAEERGLGDLFTFAGLRQDMPEMYALMDLFVLPSHREGFPRSPMEAAAMGVPSVATDIRGCREAVIPEETGLLVPLKSPKPLAEAIIRLLTDEALNTKIREGCRAIALEHFDERLVFQRVIDTYRRLLRGSASHAPSSAQTTSVSNGRSNNGYSHTKATP